MSGLVDKAGLVSAMDMADLAATLMQSRQTILPKRLTEPGPDATQLQQILNAAASAPDHGQLLPWRLVLVPTDVRGLLAEQFAAALQERDAAALPEQMEQAREKAFRAPCLMLLVVDGAKGDPEVGLAERLLSAGCSVQNLLLMATALGFGSALTSGKALKAAGWKIISAEIRYLAKNFTELSDAARKEVTDFLNALDDHDDVHRVYAAMR